MLQQIVGIVLLVLACLLASSWGLVTVNCCQKKYTSFGDSCSYSGTAVGNDTYYCVETSVYGCSACSVSSDTSYKMCSSCCVTDESACITSSASMTTSSALIIIVLSVAALSCILVFASTEFVRDDGLTFREAYLLPIPLVAVDSIIKLDSDDSWDSQDDESKKGFQGHRQREGGQRGANDVNKDNGGGGVDNNQVEQGLNYAHAAAETDGRGPYPYHDGEGESSDVVSFGSETNPRDLSMGSQGQPVILAQATAHIYSPAIPIAEPTEARGNNVYYH